MNLLLRLFPPVAMLLASSIAHAAEPAHPATSSGAGSDSDLERRSPDDSDGEASHDDDAQKPRLVGVEVGVQVGGATNPERPFSNALGVALGLRAGVVFLGHLYVGAELIDYLGATRPLFYGAYPDEGDTWRDHALQEGVDVGWGFTFGLVTLRPQFGLGNLTFSAPPWATPEDVITHANPGRSSSSLYLQPGVAGLVGLGPLYVGADLKFLEITNHPSPDGSSGAVHAVTAHVQVGVRF